MFDKIIESGSFNEHQAAKVMKQLFSAVAYCHKYQIVHRDLKPENILYESKKADSNIKVIDWGTSKEVDENEILTKKQGTPYYIAPEVIKKKYNEKCDVWSCGVIMYIMLCGTPPFNGANNKLIMKRVLTGKFSFPPEKGWDCVSKEAKNMIKKMLVVDPKKRISALEALN